MIFYSNEFQYSDSNYRKARKDVIKQIKQAFDIKGRCALPWGALVLCGYVNGKWLPLSDTTQDARKYSNVDKYKLKSLNLSYNKA